MAESARPESCGMRTARRVGWFLSALALFTMGSIGLSDSTKSPKTVKSLEYHEMFNVPGDDYLSIQGSSSQDDQTLQGGRSASDNFVSPQDYYVWNHQPTNKADNFPSADHNTKWRYASGVHYGYYTTRPPKPQANLNKRRHKRQRIKNKSRPGHSKRPRPAKKPKAHRLSPDVTVGGLPNPSIIGKASRKSTSKTGSQPYITSKRTSHHPPNSLSLSRKDKTSSESTSTSSVLQGSHHSFNNKSNSIKNTKHGDIQTGPSLNLIMSSPRTAAAAAAGVKPKSYFSHDPFLDPPSDRYDLKPSKERVVPETTTVLPKFVQSGSRTSIPDPYFLPEATKVVAHEGGVAILPCGVKYLELSQVSWGKAGRDHLLSIGPDVWVKDNRLSVVYREGPTEEESHWNLRIRHVALDDEGEYMCEIIANEKTVRTVWLQIVDKPPYNPVITIEGRKFVESAHTAYIRCNATEGDRFPEDIDWFKNGDKIDSMSYPNIVITKYRSEMTLTLVSELAVMRASARDSGTYICRSSPQLIASVDVNVLVADKSNVKRGHFSNDTNSSQSDTHTGEKKFNRNSSPQKKYETVLYLNIIFILCLFGHSKVT